MADDLERLTAALVDRFAVEGVIGKGGMATVYQATDLQLNRKVAVKVLNAEVSSAIGIARFRREIAIAAGLSHPHIVAVHDSGEAGGLLYFVMPRIEGHTLRDELDRSGPLSLERALAVMRDVAEGLDYAHAAGVVHRDIKPRNILLAGNHALIADFGVARAIEEAAAADLTTSGIAIGTPAYMSPEQAAGSHEIDARSDIYSLACVFHEMLAGEPPFRARNAQVLLGLQIAEQAPSLSHSRTDIPEGVADTVLRALAKSPTDRFSTASEFVAHLEAAAPAHAAGRLQPRWLRRIGGRIPAHMRLAVAVTSAFALVTAAWLLGSPLGRTPAWAGGRPASIVVLAFLLDDPAPDASDRRLAVDLASAITGELDAWESLRVVPRVALAGPMFDLGLTEPTIRRLEDGVRIARALSVQALLAVTVRLRGDSADVEATLFDSGSGRAVGQTFRARGPAASPLALAGPIAAGIVGLDPAITTEDAPYRQSANPEALLQDAEGRRQLERWRLREAERHFRNAIDLDSAFAMAHHRLAQTLYWQAAQDPRLFEALAPAIAGESATALRFARGLGSRDSVHLRAFFAFQAGDWNGARGMYGSLLARDSTDVYAWLMLGSIEYLDPWLAGPAPDSLRPRANLNIAVRAFSEALRLQPTFELGYGHLFDIHRDVVRGIDSRSCLVFDEPAGEQIVPWEPPPLRRPMAFCAAPLDSILWLAPASLDTLGDLAAAGADRLFDQSLRLLRRWAAYSPSEPQPLRELVTVLVAQRSRLGPGSAERSDSLTREALSWARTALRLSRDTLRVDLIRLANLYLATDSLGPALDLVTQGLARDNAGPDGRRPSTPPSAANIFLAVGQPARALSLVAGLGVTRAVRDSTTRALVPYGGAEPVIESLRVLGATGAGAPAVRESLGRLSRTWSAPRFSPAQQRLLRRDVALRLAPALIRVPDGVRDWDAGLDLDEPLWRALVLSDSAPARALTLLAAAVANPTPTLSEATRSYLQGIVAARAGDHRQAVAWFSRMDSVPLSLDALDLNWGLRQIARLHRAASRETLGDSDAALQDYEGFARAWADADSLAAPLLDAARRRIQALQARR